jgi:hypothetical protein
LAWRENPHQLEIFRVVVVAVPQMYSDVACFPGQTRGTRIAFSTSMRRLIQRAISVLIAATASACMPMPRVALHAATPADLEMLAGNWAGEYESAALGRRGSIEFKLAAGSREAYGDVVMIPRGHTLPYQQNPEYPVASPAGLENTHVLTIRFIRADNGTVRGMLDRYWDPDRACYAVTVFQGYVARAAVEGSFTTTFDCDDRQARGTWRVERKSVRR